MKKELLKSIKGNRFAVKRATTGRRDYAEVWEVDEDFPEGHITEEFDHITPYVFFREVFPSREAAERFAREELGLPLEKEVAL
jgi:hypothetical protein